MAEKPWCPDECPITGLPFFMWIDHPDHGTVPTYGGPFDSYTLPTSELIGQHRAFTRERFDHDVGGWTDHEALPLVLISEDHFLALEEAVNAGTISDTE